MQLVHSFNPTMRFPRSYFSIRSLSQTGNFKRAITKLPTNRDVYQWPGGTLNPTHVISVSTVAQSGRRWSQNRPPRGLGLVCHEAQGQNQYISRACRNRRWRCQPVVRPGQLSSARSGRVQAMAKSRPRSVLGESLLSLTRGLNRLHVRVRFECRQRPSYPYRISSYGGLRYV
jgi:hypothetical protein